MCNLLHTNTHTHTLFLGRLFGYGDSAQSLCSPANRLFRKSKVHLSKEFGSKKTTTPWGRTVCRLKRYLKMMRLKFLLRNNISREKDEKKWGDQNKRSGRKQLYKNILSIGCCRITTIWGLMTGKSTHMFLRRTKNWRYDFQWRHFTSKQSKVNAPRFLGVLGWVDLIPSFWWYRFIWMETHLRGGLQIV